MTPLSRLLSPPGRPGLLSTQQARPAAQMGVSMRCVPFLGHRAHRHWHATRCRMQRPASRAGAQAWSAGVCRLPLKRTIPHYNRHS